MHFDRKLLTQAVLTGDIDDLKEHLLRINAFSPGPDNIRPESIGPVSMEAVGSLSSLITFSWRGVINDSNHLGTEIMSALVLPDVLGVQAFTVDKFSVRTQAGSVLNAGQEPHALLYKLDKNGLIAGAALADITVLAIETTYASTFAAATVLPGEGLAVGCNTSAGFPVNQFDGLCFAARLGASLLFTKMPARRTA